MPTMLDVANVTLGARRSEIGPAQASAIGGNQTLGKSCPWPSPSSQLNESSPGTSRQQCRGHCGEEHPAQRASPSPGQGDASSQVAHLSLKPKSNSALCEQPGTVPPLGRSSACLPNPAGNPAPLPCYSWEPLQLLIPLSLLLLESFIATHCL